MIRLVLALAVLSQSGTPSRDLSAPLNPVDPNAPLPPGHPAVGSRQAGPVDPNAPLPPGHPAVGQPPPAASQPLGPVDPNAPLPPGHPGLGEPSSAPAALPAGHPQVSADQKPLSSADLLKKLDGTADLKTREKTFEVAAALGKLYYANSRFADSVTYLRQALTKTEGTRAILLDARRKNGGQPVPGAAEAGCAETETSTFDGQTALAREALRSGKAAAAVACAQLAIAPVVEAERILANALFLSGDAEGALGELDRAVTLDDRDPEAAFLRGAVRLDAHGEEIKALQAAKADLSRCIDLAPMGPRASSARALVAQVDKAIAAGGIAKLDVQHAKEDQGKQVPVARAPMAPFAPFAGGGGAPGGGGRPPALTQDQIDAVQNTERTPELMQGLAKLIEEGEENLAHGRYQDAVDVYKRVVPFDTTNARAVAGMAWGEIGLGRPMGEMVWNRAVGMDPAAVDKLGDTLKAKGDSAGARRLWEKLAQSAPSYGPVKGKL